MFRRTSATLLKHRPKTVSIEPGSNRDLPEPLLSKSKEIFAVPDFPSKLVLHNWRFFIKSGKAATGPPVGQEFSKLGLKVMDFTKAFNDRTKPVLKEEAELMVRIQVYFDKSYSYRIEPPPTTWFLLRAIRKKRRETGAVNIKGHYCAYITLEMIYEIAKIKQIKWSRWDFPSIEGRVRRIAGQARRMGVCIIGVDTPSSPQKGLTDKQYEAECAKYREIHMQQFVALQDKQLDSAPLLERLHRPDLSKLTPDQLQQGLLDPNLFHSLWVASQPGVSEGEQDLKDRELAMKFMNTRGWFRDMTPDELKTVFFNYKLGDAERDRALGKIAESPEIGRDSKGSA
ncbi:ribosomal protein L11, putative [Bodo saltans]|uniref:Ribosomal protein L11, putative n=1 Tax=Bodo saltans TaxID=75058 RepID=A0A0S4IQP6_BODSA|nr:ribosomal protein L11, putative [Bodo saltans]|eukprot:CUF97380.1 ribosomal protein L11, putative [Bodo saltans]